MVGFRRAAIRVVAQFEEEQPGYSEAAGLLSRDVAITAIRFVLKASCVHLRMRP